MAALIGWFPQTQLMKVVIVGERKLAVVASLQKPSEPGGPWICVAVETAGSSVESILEGHGHDNLGEFPSLADAMTAGEAYLERWSGEATIKACDCEELESLD